MLPLANRAGFTQQIFSSRIKTPAGTYVGEIGRIFYHEDTGELRISDGITPGGLPIFGGGGGTGTGTVTSVSVSTANGFSATITNPTTTPAITLHTPIIGMLKGNGTGMVAATAGSDFLAPNTYALSTGLSMNTDRILGRTDAGVGPAQEITIGNNLTLVNGVLSATTQTGGGGSATLDYYAEHGSHPVTAPAVSADGLIALGDGSLTTWTGGLTQAAGIFAHSGDAQIGSYVARQITNDDQWHEIFLDGASAQMMMPQNTTMAFTITIVARRTDSGGEGAVYELRGAVDRNISTISTRIVGHLNRTVVTEDNSAWDVTADTNTSTGAFRIWAKAVSGSTVRWVAQIQTVEVRN